MRTRNSNGKRMAPFVAIVGIVLTLVCFGAWADPSGERLRILAQARGFLIGYASINNFASLSDSTIYQNTAKSEFNILTPENQMKWSEIHPSQTGYNFGPADQHVAFAQANGMKVHGHTLVWHQQLPSWVTGRSWTSSELTAVLYSHIDNVVGHYRGKIEVWDVVNEALESDGSYKTSLWYTTLGPSFIELAFKRARQVDSATKLVYNDFSVEVINAKSNAMYNMVKSFKSRGIPIDGVGLQMHLIGSGLDYQSLADNLARFAALGVSVYITEMDVRISQNPSQAELDSQASVYKNVISRCLAQPACKALQVWGFTDKYSWIPAVFPGLGAALILDSSYNAKSAYYALQSELKAGVPPSGGHRVRRHLRPAH